VFIKNDKAIITDVVPWIMTCLRGRGESETDAAYCGGGNSDRAALQGATVCTKPSKELTCFVSLLVMTATGRVHLHVSLRKNAM
jgi:hypothetical protein